MVGGLTFGKNEGGLTNGTDLNDPNGDGKFQLSEVNVAQCSAFSGGVSTFYAADGVDWPYSDEIAAGVETQVMSGMRVGAMFYYRTNRDQFGQRNTAVPTATSYTPFTFTIPNGPGGTVASPKPMSVTAYNLAAALSSAQNIIRDNESYLDTEYKGVEFTASKRFSRRWQMVGGLTFGKNEGGLTNGTDLNDPNGDGKFQLSEVNVAQCSALREPDCSPQPARRRAVPERDERGSAALAAVPLRRAQDHAAAGFLQHRQPGPDCEPEHRSGVDVSGARRDSGAAHHPGRVQLRFLRSKDDGGGCV